MLTQTIIAENYVADVRALREAWSEIRNSDKPMRARDAAEF